MAPIDRPLRIADAIEELLAPIVLDDCTAEVRNALHKRAEQLLQLPTPHSQEISPQERSYLLTSGAFTLEELAESEQRVGRGALREAEYRSELGAMAASYCETDVAHRLGIQPDEVRDRSTSGKLFAFNAGGSWLYPKWQFDDETPEGVLPHLARILDALRPDEREPASVQGFMTSLQADLVDGAELTPRQWLLRGGAAEPIEDILEGDRWR